MLPNKRKIHYFHFLRAISVFVLICFATTTIAWGTPTLSTKHGIEIPISSLLANISIPQEIGLIRDTYAAPVENDPAHRTPYATPVIIHIEEAHGQTEGQENIEKILTHLKIQYGLKTVFLEGTWGKLDPESLRFFRDPKINRELLNDLSKKGLIGGVEMFLSENWDSSLGTGDSQKRLSQTSLDVQVPSPKPQGYGVENVKLYRENLEQFRKVCAAKPQTDAFLKDLRQKIADGSSREFNPELKKFFKDWAFRTEIAELPFAGLDMLRENAGKYLSLDLSDASKQYDWPQLVRFFKLKNLEGFAPRDSGSAKSEIQRLKDWLTAKKLTSLSGDIEKFFDESLVPGSQSLSEDIRAKFERFYETVSPYGFKFEDYPNLTRRIGIAILSSELQAPDLFREVEKLNDLVLDKLAKTNEEKKLIEQYKEYCLLKRLFSLELSREEYQKMSMYGVRSTGYGEKTNTARRTPSTVQNTYAVALEFYVTAQKREQVIFENMLNRMKEIKDPNAVLVTGGFHSEGLSKFFKKNGISYVRISPRITKPEQPTSYLDVMLFGNQVKNKSPAVSESRFSRGSVGDEDRRSETSSLGSTRQPSLIQGITDLQKLGARFTSRYNEGLQESIEKISSQRQVPVNELIAPRFSAEAASRLVQNIRSEVRGEIGVKTTVLPVAQTKKEVLASEFVTALGLDSIQRIEGMTEIVPGFRVYRVEIQEPDLQAPLLRGTSILYKELAHVRKFDLLYNKSDELIGIFPALNGVTKKGFYFDLSNYYVPYDLLKKFGGQFSRRELVQSWQAASGKILQDHEGVKAYLAQLPAEFAAGLSDKMYRNNIEKQLREPFVYAELDESSNGFFVTSFSPEALALGDSDASYREEYFEKRLFRIFESRGIGTRRIIIPVFPLVYSPAYEGLDMSDRRFLELVYRRAKIFDFGDGNNLLDAATGTGILAWILWQATQKVREQGKQLHYYAIDINPLAVANARVLAKLADMPLSVIQHDNIVNSRGDFAFGDTRFRFVTSNSPAHTSSAQVQHSLGEISLSDFFDYVPFFPNFAKGLALRLEKGGEIYAWNMFLNQKNDAVPGIFKEKGFSVRVLPLTSAEVAMSGGGVAYVVTPTLKRSENGFSYFSISSYGSVAVGAVLLKISNRAEFSAGQTSRIAAMGLTPAAKQELIQKAEKALRDFSSRSEVREPAKPFATVKKPVLVSTPLNSVVFEGQEYTQDMIARYLQNVKQSEQFKFGILLFDLLPYNQKETFIASLPSETQKKLRDYLATPHHTVAQLIVKPLKNQDFTARFSGAIHISIGNDFEKSLRKESNEKVRFEIGFDRNRKLILKILFFGEGKEDREVSYDLAAGKTYIVSRERIPEEHIEASELFTVNNQFLSAGMHFSFRVVQKGDETWMTVRDFKSTNGTILAAEVYPGTVAYPRRDENLAFYKTYLEKMIIECPDSKKADNLPPEVEETGPLYEKAVREAVQLYLDSAEFPELEELRKKLIQDYLVADAVGHSRARSQFAMRMLELLSEDDRIAVWEPVLEVAKKYMTVFVRLVQVLATDKIQLAPTRLKYEIFRSLAHMAKDAKPIYDTGIVVDQKEMSRTVRIDIPPTGSTRSETRSSSTGDEELEKWNKTFRQIVEDDVLKRAYIEKSHQIRLQKAKEVRKSGDIYKSLFIGNGLDPYPLIEVKKLQTAAYIVDKEYSDDYKEYSSDYMAVLKRHARGLGIAIADARKRGAGALKEDEAGVRFLGALARYGSEVTDLPGQLGFRAKRDVFDHISVLDFFAGQGSAEFLFHGRVSAGEAGVFYKELLQWVKDEGTVEISEEGFRPVAVSPLRTLVQMGSSGFFASQNMRGMVLPELKGTTILERLLDASGFRFKKIRIGETRIEKDPIFLYTIYKTPASSRSELRDGEPDHRLATMNQSEKELAVRIVKGINNLEILDAGGQRYRIKSSWEPLSTEIDVGVESDGITNHAFLFEAREDGTWKLLLNPDPAIRGRKLTAQLLQKIAPHIPSGTVLVGAISNLDTHEYLKSALEVRGNKVFRKKDGSPWSGFEVADEVVAADQVNWRDIMTVRGKSLGYLLSKYFGFDLTEISIGVPSDFAHPNIRGQLRYGTAALRQFLKSPRAIEFRAVKRAAMSAVEVVTMPPENKRSEMREIKSVSRAENPDRIQPIQPISGAKLRQESSKKEPQDTYTPSSKDPKKDGGIYTLASLKQKAAVSASPVSQENEQTGQLYPIGQTKPSQKLLPAQAPGLDTPGRSEQRVAVDAVEGVFRISTVLALGRLGLQNLLNDLMPNVYANEPRNQRLEKVTIDVLAKTKNAPFRASITLNGKPSLNDPVIHLVTDVLINKSAMQIQVVVPDVTQGEIRQFRQALTKKVVAGRREQRSDAKGVNLVVTAQTAEIPGFLNASQERALVYDMRKNGKTELENLTSKVGNNEALLVFDDAPLGKKAYALLAAFDRLFDKNKLPQSVQSAASLIATSLQIASAAAQEIASAA